MGVDIVIDIVLILVLAITVFCGYRKGIQFSLFEMMKIVCNSGIVIYTFVSHVNVAVKQSGIYSIDAAVILLAAIEILKYFDAKKAEKGRERQRINLTKPVS